MKRQLQTIKSFLYILVFLVPSTLAGYASSKNHGIVHAGTQVQNLVTGVVLDETKQPLPGVSIKVEGSSTGVMTDENGTYKINVPDGAVLVFSYVGYMTQTILVNGKKTLNVSLQPDNANLQEVVVLGYGKQKKATLTGAISSISNKELVQSPVANISNALGGRLPGLVALQQSGEPGYDQSRIKIRGIATLGEGKDSDPLILVDGVERNMNLVDPNEVESVSVLKDASATAVFGVRGANGVIIITTKTGQAGAPQISYTSNFGLQSPTQLPKMLNSFDYATLRNEAQTNMGQDPYFSQQDLDAFQSGNDPIFHPNVDWFDKVLKPNSLQQQHNFNIGGGFNNTRYFISLGYFDQQGAYDVGELQKEYSANPRYKRYNIRSNFDIDFNKDFSASIKLGGQFADRNYPGQGAGAIFFRILSSNPLMNPGVIDGKLISSVQGLPSSVGNPLSFIATNGYSSSFNSNLNTNISLQHKLDFITEGLKLRGTLAYDTYYTHGVNRGKAAIQYKIIKDPLDPKKPIYLREGEEAPFSFSESYDRWRKIYGEFAAEYSRSFGDHNVTGLALYNLEKITDPASYYGQGGLNYPEIPRSYMGFVGRVTYNYRSKYLSEFNLGYNGSENFPENKRFGFFPSLSLGWVLTEESFLSKSNLLSLLKIRGSYGEVGNDRMGDRRFLSQPDVYNYGGGYYFGEVGNNYNFYGGSQEGALGNPNVTWERAKKSNIGLESGFFKNKLRINADFFMEKRDNILITLGTVPDIVQATLPPVNFGKVENKGYELEANFNSNIGKVNYWVKTNYSFAKNKIIHKDEPNRPYEWLRETGRPVGQYFGLISEGLFNTVEELAAAPKSSYDAELQLGDVRYKDLNEDGVIDANDRAPIGFSSFPQVFYGISFGFEYKGFDFSALFQGSDKVSTYIDQMAAWPFDTDWRSAQSKHMERWTPERYAAGEKITFPRLELSPTEGKHNYVRSDYWLIDGSYVRLKNLEVAYRFKGRLLERAGIKSLRFFANGNNLITWSKIKNYDPESPAGRGEFYPQMKVYNFGVNVQF
ncbi:TonB-dependent receptor [Pedobacter sp. B4-66]|uniref:SusC/RagA family TonB-linked outer membrane protein n=1 Tax=Pedobacter sp. B4-66 TaxID=2817280 RepID=UPI001BDA03CE|nr:TonB-dependent receptor [Pedobacter sp. B4-66]